MPRTSLGVALSALRFAEALWRVLVGGAAASTPLPPDCDAVVNVAAAVVSDSVADAAGDQKLVPSMHVSSVALRSAHKGDSKRSAGERRLAATHYCTAALWRRASRGARKLSWAGGCGPRELITAPLNRHSLTNRAHK